MKQRCEECATIGDCKHAFGKYWGDKSLGGVGCDHPFSYQRDTRGTTAARPENIYYNKNNNIKQGSLI